MCDTTGRVCSDRSGCSQGPCYRHRHEQDCAPHRLCPVHVLCPTRTLCTLVHQTTLPEDTPSQAPLSRNPPAAAPTHSETRVLPGQPLLPTHTAEQGACAQSCPSRGTQPQSGCTERAECWSWQQSASGITDNVQKESETGFSGHCRGSITFISCWNNRTSISLLPK